MTESLVLSHAKWLNFVSPGFNNYSHINVKRVNLFTNGIDNIFTKKKYLKKKHLKRLTILYAGNIGLSQGLDLIVLPIAKRFKDKIVFKLIGDGSSVSLIKAGIVKDHIKNIKLIPPIKRIDLLGHYQDADVLFLQLSDLPAFNNVIPSKIFDYGALEKPILAGVKGTARDFMKENLSGAYLFDPGDTNAVEKYINFFLKGLPEVNHSKFKTNFERKRIMDKMLVSLINRFSQ